MVVSLQSTEPLIISNSFLTILLRSLKLKTFQIQNFVSHITDHFSAGFNREMNHFDCEKKWSFKLIFYNKDLLSACSLAFLVVGNIFQVWWNFNIYHQTREQLRSRQSKHWERRNISVFVFLQSNIYG